MPLTNWLWSATSPAPPILRSVQNQPLPSCYREIVAWDSFAGAAKDHRVLRGIVLLLLLRFVTAAVMNLSSREAHYRNYSIHPALSHWIIHRWWPGWFEQPPC